MNTEIFRLAAILYADNNYELSPKTIHRKIIESIFIQIENKLIGIHSLIDIIKDDYNLDFTLEEISAIVSDKEYFATSPSRDEEMQITLTGKRFANISSKLDKNNLDHFIIEFHKENPDYELSILRDVVYKFLYEIFQTNITSFSKLIDPKIPISDLLNINDLDFSTIDTETINEFLNWDNDLKNKAIFDIANLALEYCLITNKKGSNFKLENLKNKNFYLDTNVIFRAIGLNGENRKNRTLTFLAKFKEANENLFISKFTAEEITKTFKFHIDQISKYNTARINSKIFTHFSKNEDFINFYHKWRRTRQNDSFDLFKGYLNSLIEELKSEFNIKNDFKNYFEITDSKVEEQILDKASQINNFKNSNKNSPSYIESNIIDAKNIYLIEMLRNGQYVNIFDCKHYLISSDQFLRKWDYVKNQTVPIVILPSQWMTLLLRYLHRSDDDFKSFVSFLNINNTEKGISNENLQLILSGISEITSDLSQQNKIVSEMINLKFQGIIDSSDEQIIENSRIFAKSKLEEDIDELKRKNSNLSTKFEKYQENTSHAIKVLEQGKESEKNKKDREIEKNDSILQDLINTKARLDFNKYKSKAYYCIPIAIFCMVYFFLLFAYNDHPWNMVAVYTKYANSLEEGSMQKEFCTWLWLFPTSLFIGSMVIIYRRLLDTENKKSKINALREIWSNELTK